MAGSDRSPFFETSRLRLRPYQPTDFDDYALLWSDPIVTRAIGGLAFTREQSWTRFLRHPGLWAFLGFGPFAVFDRATGAHVGEVGFHDLKRTIEPSLEGTMETGWAFHPGVHGRGYATEAVQAVLAWADANKPGLRITCFIETGHGASMRVAEKCGFREFARADYNGKPVIMFERCTEGNSSKGR